MRERDVEKYLREQVEARGGLCLKWVSPGWTGAPDRIVIMPPFEPHFGEPYFIELKAPGKKPTKLQVERIRALGDLEQNVGWIDSYEAVDRFIAHGVLNAV